MTTKRDNRFAAPKKRTRATKKAADRDQRVREAENRIHWLTQELASQERMHAEIKSGTRFMDRVFGLLRGLGLSESRARQETAIALDVDLIPPELQADLDDLRRYAHEIGTVGSSQRAMNAVNALCKWGVQGTARREAGGNKAGISQVANGWVKNNDLRGAAWIAGSCGKHCALSTGHEDAHLGACGCTNGCKAWNCPNL